MDNPLHNTDSQTSSSPKWSSTTKLIVGLTLTSLAFVLLFSFRSILGPFLLALVMSYLIYPLADVLRRVTHLPWRGVVNVIYALTFILLMGLIIWGTLFLINQIQNLVTTIQSAINNLPTFLTDITARPLSLGPFNFVLQPLDLVNISQQVLGFVQPVLKNTYDIVSGFVGNIASIIGWIIFIFVVSFFLLSETGGNPNRLINIQIPGYKADINRMGLELARIWNAFLRGQLTVYSLTLVIYTVILGLLGVNYFLGLALVAGLAWFLPYVGSLINYVAIILVSFTLGSSIFTGLDHGTFTLITMAIILIVDAILFNFVSPRIFSTALKVHPAAVLVAALIMLNLLGIVGFILAAPTLATIKLFLDYSTRKMLDLDPWAEVHYLPQPQPPSIKDRLKLWKEDLRSIFDRARLLFQRK